MIKGENSISHLVQSKGAPLYKQMKTAQEFIRYKSKQFVEKRGKRFIRMKDIGRKGWHYFDREAWAFLPQHNLKDKKIFVLERLRKVSYDGKVAYFQSWKKDDIEYRLGYYIVGRIGKAKGRWLWGQFCPMIPDNDFKKLLKKAKQEKVFLG